MFILSIYLSIYLPTYLTHPPTLIRLPTSKRTLLYFKRTPLPPSLTHSLRSAPAALGHATSLYIILPYLTLINYLGIFACPSTGHNVKTLGCVRVGASVSVSVRGPWGRGAEGRGEGGAETLRLRGTRGAKVWWWVVVGSGRAHTHGANKEGKEEGFNEGGREGGGAGRDGGGCVRARFGIQYDKYVLRYFRTFPTYLPFLTICALLLFKKL